MADGLGWTRARVKEMWKISESEVNFGGFGQEIISTLRVEMI